MQLFETVNWVFSTLPQVLAALAGLMMAGILYLYPNLNKRVEDDASLYETVFEIKRNLRNTFLWVLISTTIAIIVDVLIMINANPIVKMFPSENDDNNYVRILWIAVVILVSFINIYPILRIITGIASILHPEYERRTIIKETKRIEKRALKEQTEERIKEKKLRTQSSHNRKNLIKSEKIDQMQYLELFIKFERAIRAYCKSKGYPENQNIREMVKACERVQLFNSKITHSLEDAIKIRNLIAHGTSILKIPTSVINALEYAIGFFTHTESKYS